MQSLITPDDSIQRIELQVIFVVSDGEHPPPTDDGIQRRRRLPLRRPGARGDGRRRAGPKDNSRGENARANGAGQAGRRGGERCPAHETISGTDGCLSNEFQRAGGSVGRERQRQSKRGHRTPAKNKLHGCP